jgi:hypothetical protein
VGSSGQREVTGGQTLAGHGAKSEHAQRSNKSPLRVQHGWVMSPARWRMEGQLIGDPAE